MYQSTTTVVGNTHEPSSPPVGTALAVTYLRVSTKEQAEKGGTDEGFSIPAQRDANHRKAESLGATIVEEFIDAGESARTADRPDLMRMIEYVQTHKVAYCIVHKVDRLARNRADDVTIHLALRDAGVMLVSATENIDETPSGMLLHGIMSSIAEFYSRNLATEVVKGMSQKAANGGTVGKAPIGYLNTIFRDDVGREVRGVTVDGDRAPLVEWAFKAYASGDWTVSQITDELKDRGLVSVPTPRRHSGPLVVSSVHRMLTNPYYKGDIVYKGVLYRGQHEALVPPEVWYQVQSVMAAHKSAADATQVHNHYLKGSVYCGQCGSRLIISNAKNRHGSVYPYFVCAGRHAKRTSCTRQAVLIEMVEKLIEDYYTRVGLTPTHRDALSGMLRFEFDRMMAAETEELSRLTTNRDELEAEQLRLLRAYHADAIPMNLMKKEQARLVAELDQISSRLEQNHSEYAAITDTLDKSLEVLDDIAGLYARCDDVTRRMCNQAFFEKIYVDEDSIRPALAEPFETLLDPAVHANALTWAKNTHGARTPAESSSSAEGLNPVRLVPPTGFEPALPP